MSKRHTNQNHKQAKGQYFTTNCDKILSGFESIVRNKTIIEPFAGKGDLIEWSLKNGAKDYLAYDLEPAYANTIQNDSLINPPDYSKGIVVTNPPYLSKNKCKEDKSVFEQWNQNDYYKCHLASLLTCDEAIVIIPSNFLCESSITARKRLFETHSIVQAKYWNEPVFDDATTGICALHLRKIYNRVQRFPIEIYPENKKFDMVLEERYNYLFGKDFFDFINRSPNKLKFVKTDKGMNPPNTNFVVGLLDKGTWNNGIRYNSGDPIYCGKSSFTTYQLTIPNLILSESEQKEIVNIFQEKFTYFRNKYQSMFLSNYMGPKQKILSRSYVQKFLEVVILDFKKTNTLF